MCSLLVLESWLDFTGELEPPDPLTRLPQLKRHIKQLLMDMGKVQQIATLCSVWRLRTPTEKGGSLQPNSFHYRVPAGWRVKKIAVFGDLLTCDISRMVPGKRKWRATLSRKWIRKRIYEQATNDTVLYAQGHESRMQSMLRELSWHSSLSSWLHGARDTCRKKYSIFT